MSGPAGSPQVVVSLGYTSGLAGPSEFNECGDEQFLMSSVAAVRDTPPPLAVVHHQHLAPRQPPPAVTAAAISPTHTCTAYCCNICIFVTARCVLSIMGFLYVYLLLA